VTLETRNIETADLEDLAKFTLARIIPSWNPARPEAHEFIRSVARFAMLAAKARTAGTEGGEMVMGFDELNAVGRSELRELTNSLRVEAAAEGNRAAAAWFQGIEDMLESEAESRIELQRIFDL
jgi:hypothetical protein